MHWGLSWISKLIEANANVPNAILDQFGNKNLNNVFNLTERGGLKNDKKMWTDPTYKHCQSKYKY